MLLLLGMLCVFLSASAQYKASNLVSGGYNTAVGRDNAGNLYTVEADPSGQFYNLVQFPINNPTSKTTIGYNLSASINKAPWSIVVNSSGDVFIINPNPTPDNPSGVDGSEILRYHKSGSSWTETQVVAGAAYAALAMDASNNLYAVEYDHSSKYIITQYAAGMGNMKAVLYSGALLTYPTGASTFPTGLVVDNSYFYVTGFPGTASDKLLKIPFGSSNDAAVQVIGTGRSFVSLAWDANGNLLSTEASTGGKYHIVRYTMPLFPGATGTEIYNGLSQIQYSFPWGLVATADNTIFAGDVASAGNGRIVNLQTPMNATVTGGANSVKSNASTVNFVVNFDQDVTGVSATDFGVFSTGTVAGTSIGSITSTNARQYTVTVNTGTGDGMLDLKLLNTGNMSRYVIGAPKNANAAYIIDKTPPNASFTINGGAAFTNSLNVSLQIIPDDATVMAFSNDNVTWTGDMPAAAAGNFTLFNADGLRTVYIRFTDAAGNTVTKTSQINLDRVVPYTIINSGPGGAAHLTNSTSAPFNVNASKPGCTVLYSLDGGAYTQIPSNIFTLSGMTEGSHTVKFMSADQAGNVEVTPKAYTWTVDLTPPSVSIVTPPTDGTYNQSSRRFLNIKLQFNENVNVTGNPIVGITIGGVSRSATYISGSGGTTLTFQYGISNGENAPTGIIIVSPISLNGGTIQDGAGNNAVLTFTPPNTSGVLVNTKTPTCSISAPATVYGPFTLTITFSEYVTGMTLGAITIGNATTSNLQTTDNITYTVSVTPQNNGNVSIIVPQNKVQNTGSNFNLASNSLSVNYDKTPPAITSLTLPANGTYKIGDVLNFAVTYDKPVVVTGGPTLDVVLSSGTVSAAYQGMTGNTLNFAYTVVSGDLEPANINVGAAINLNGGTIIGVNTQNAGLNLPSALPNSVKVDGILPTLTSVTAPADGYYNTTTNKVLTYTVSYSKPITVTGTPTLDVTIGGVTRQAGYATGSGTNTLTFTYNIQAGDNDPNGIGTAGAIALNGGTMKDATGYNAPLTFTAPNTSGVKVNTNTPSCIVSTSALTVYGDFTATITFSEAVSGMTASKITLTNATISNLQTTDHITYTCLVSPQVDGNVIISVPAGVAQNTGGYGNTAGVPVTVYYDKNPPVVSALTLPGASRYKLGDVIAFLVTYDKPIVVTGTPTLDIVLNSGIVKAQYIGTIGTDVVGFQYTVATGDLDNDNIGVGAAINLNGGTIIGANNMNADLNLPTADPNNGVKIDGIIPVVSSVTVPADGYYNSTSKKVLTYTVTFPEPVIVTGTPAVEVTIGTFTRMATYNSGSGTATLTFSYTVVTGDQDLDGIATGVLTNNGGNITDLAGNPANMTLNGVGSTANVFVSTKPPTVSITAPSLVTGPFTATFTFSEQVTGFTSAVINTGGMANVSNVQTTNGITYTATITPTTETLMTIGLAANAVQSLGLNGNIANSVQVRYSAVPVVQQTNVPLSKYYITGDFLQFMVTYQKNVVVNTTGGTPYLEVTIGSKTVRANYVLTSGKNIAFQYAVVAGDEALSGIQLDNVIHLNGATIQDIYGVNADLTLNNIPATNNIFVYTTIPAATITGTAKTNQPYTITVAFNEAVTGLTTGSFNVTNATLSNLQAGANNTYTVLVTPVATGNVTVQLKAGAVRNIANVTNAASNVLTTAYDGTAPVVSLVNIPANGYYNATQTLTFTVSFSKPITVTGSPVLPLTIGTNTVNAGYVSGSGSNILTFRYAIQPGDMDMDGIDLASAINLNGATIADDFSNNAVLTLNNVPSTAQVRVNTSHPTVSLSGNTARVNTPVNVTAAFSESVTGLTATSFTVVNGVASNLTTTDNKNYTVTITPAADGNVAVSLAANVATNIGNNGNNASNTLQFVYDATPPVVTIPTMDVSGDAPLGTLVGKLTATDALGTIQNWTIVTDAANGAFALDANGNVTVKNIPALKALANSNTSITITVSDGVNTTAPVVVNIHVGPLFVNKAPTMDPIADQTICADNLAHSIQLTSLSAVETDQTFTLRLASDAAIFDQLTVSNTGVLIYKFKSTLTSGDANITVTIQDNGGTANNGVDTLQRTFHLRVNATPVVTITADKPNPVSKGDVIQLTATGGDLFAWDAVDGIISGQQTSTLVARVKADANFKVTVSNVTGCTSSATYAVKSNNDFKVDAINMLTPNGDGINDKWVIKNIDLYTNNEVKIFDRSGRLVYQRKNYNNEWDGTINGHALSEGTYYYILTIEGGAKTAKGFITIVR